MGEYVLLTTTPPSLPTIPEGILTVLVFDATLAGYRQAAVWIAQHPDIPIHRLLIPFSMQFRDAGDYFEANSKEERLGVAGRFPPSYTFPLEPIDMEETEARPWPFKSANRVVDFKQASVALQNELVLRDVRTGLSKIQLFMLQHREMEGDVVVAMTAAQFKLPLALVRQEQHKLCIGNLPAWTNGVIDVLPQVLLNGPVPFPSALLAEELKRWINFGTQPNWDTFSPSDLGCTVVQHTSSVTRDAEGTITALPYGVSKLAFQQANPGMDEGTCWTPIRFSKECDALLEVELVWDPVFLQGTFSSIQAYMKEWTSLVRLELVALRKEMMQQIPQQERQRDFLRTIFVHKEVQNAQGLMIKCFLEETLDQKRARLDRDYESDYSLLELPVRLLDRDKIDFADDVEIPDSPLDLWLQKLDPYFK